MPLLAADFESAASAISPPRLKHFYIIPKNRSNSKSYRIIFFGALQLRFIGLYMFFYIAIKQAFGLDIYESILAYRYIKCYNFPIKVMNQKERDECNG